MSNINDNFFDGQYKDIWRQIIPAELTQKELEFMVPYFKLDAGSKVLDLMCGYGRHALGLGRQGISVTAIDNLPDYINEVRETAQKESLPVKAVLANVADHLFEDEFDLALCMGNSLNFFPAGEIKPLLTNVATHLKKGGHLLINSWSIAEIAIKNFSPRGWNQIGAVKFLTEGQWLAHPSRIETRSVVIAADGHTEEKTGIDYIYSLNEMEQLLQEAGLRLLDVYSIPGRKKFTLGEPRAYLVAQLPA